MSASPRVERDRSPRAPHVELSPIDDAVTQAWFGPGIPTNAAKATRVSFENALDSQTEKATIDVAVVCNDEEMLPEQKVLDEFYDRNRGIGRNVTLCSDVSCSEMASLFTDDHYDLLHFIGHASPEGLYCRDGPLDVCGLESVGVDLFLLNACQTYHHARALIDGGAVAGVATTARITNRDATIVGRNISRLLSDGFSMSAAFEQATMHLEAGSQYLVVGDGLSRFSTKEGAPPTVLELRERGEDLFELSVSTYLRESDTLGTLTENYVYDENETEKEWEEMIFDPGTTSGHALGLRHIARSVMEFADEGKSTPVRFGNKLHWPESEADVVRLLER
ncbi:hypothetical protein [Haloarchaeobius sp. DT45]|uniref:hypothetical protein n=1 Tax=Haloarchaeobius sp. DT45 TaxID=3446116 RepID=UPI003F6A6BBD